MKVELVTIGDELLLGFTLDSNGAFLARELAAVGIAVARRTSVGDDADAIASAVRDALDRTGAAITTGGLGPTSDDVTTAGVARVFGSAAATPLANRHGSAPGAWLEDRRGRWVAMLPGVPREMRGMFAEEVLPRVRERMPTGAASSSGAPDVIVSRTIRTTGIAESLLAGSVAPVTAQLADLSLAWLPGWAGVDLRLTSRGRDAAASARALDAGEAVLRGVAGAHVYGRDADDLAQVVLDLCRVKGYTIAVAESCTGGLLGARITAVPGASHYFVGGVIAYSNEVKATHLGVGDDTLIAHGAVSEETAREMAAGVRARYRANVAMSLTGVAGPGGGTTAKPVGMVCLGIDVNGEVTTATRVMTGDREEIRQRSAQWALDQLRRRVGG